MLAHSKQSGFAKIPYMRPGPTGGRLIRDVIAFLRSQGLELPITSHILIAVSGGNDSVGLAHLLVHLGRRIAPKVQISLLHINHGWRAAESDGDEDFVVDLGKRWGVPVITRRLSPPTSEHLPEDGLNGERLPGSQNRHPSWEDQARKGRKKIFQEEASRCGAVVFTAHQADDLAETILWRLFTGAATTHGGGIAFQHGVEMRPFLTVRKSKIQAYLSEVGQFCREDSTNYSERFMRARMRQRLMPEIEKLFPRSTEHLVSLALKAQAEVTTQDREANKNNTRAKSLDKNLDLPGNLDDHLSKSPLPYEILFQAAGLKARRPHLELIIQKWIDQRGWCGEIHLPGGWKLGCEREKNSKESSGISERWVLERI